MPVVWCLHFGASHRTLHFGASYRTLSEQPFLHFGASYRTLPEQPFLRLGTCTELADRSRLRALRCQSPNSVVHFGASHRTLSEQPFLRPGTCTELADRSRLRDSIVTESATATAACLSIDIRTDDGAHTNRRGRSRTMPRRPRVALPGCPYHLTHRGNKRELVFLDSEDRYEYLRWVARYATRFGLEIWAYCLMSNHVHLIVVPREPDSLSKAIGCAHGRYAREFNKRHEWTGHAWAARFFSTPLDETHLWTAVRYVELNPVRAGIVAQGQSYPWSSAAAHVSGSPDPLLAPSRPFPGQIEDWAAWLANGISSKDCELIRKNTEGGWATGSDEFVDRLERLIGRPMRPRRSGPDPARSSRG